VTIGPRLPQILILIMLAGAFQSSASDLQALRGVVRDQTGAVLQGATVELTDQGGAVIQTGSTDARGAFLIERVSPGTYTLKVQFEGFRPATVHLRVAPRRAP